MVIKLVVALEDVRDDAVERIQVLTDLLHHEINSLAHTVEHQTRNTRSRLPGKALKAYLNAAGDVDRAIQRLRSGNEYLNQYIDDVLQPDPGHPVLLAARARRHDNGEADCVEEFPYSRTEATMSTMMSRPKVLLSAAMSLDGYLDDTSPDRLVLSSPEDLADVKRLRSRSDAIMIGANTIRRDNPSLRATEPPHPRKITITGTGQLDPAAQFFTTGTTPIVFCAHETIDSCRDQLGNLAEIHPLPTGAGLPEALTTLRQLGVRRLMVEGGGQIHTQFLTQGLADELRLAVAPFLVGDRTAPRFVSPGKFVNDHDHRMGLRHVEHLGDTTIMYYTLDPASVDGH